MERNSIEIFYEALNISSNAMIDTIIGGVFLLLRWKKHQRYQIRLWHTWEVDIGSYTYAIRDSSEHKVVDDTLAQKFSYLRINIGLLRKKFAMMNFEKVNELGTQGRTSRSYDSDVEEKKKYLEKQLAGFQARANIFSRKFKFQVRELRSDLLQGQIQRLEQREGQ